jgi:hypothetical protein
MTRIARFFFQKWFRFETDGTGEAASIGAIPLPAPRINN